MLECRFSWQAQHLAKFCEIAGARNAVFFHTKCVSKARQVTSANGWVRDDQVRFGSCSGSFSNRPPLYMTLHLMAGAAFGAVGVSLFVLGDYLLDQLCWKTIL